MGGGLESSLRNLNGCKKEGVDLAKSGLKKEEVLLFPLSLLYPSCVRKKMGVKANGFWVKGLLGC